MNTQKVDIIDTELSAITGLPTDVVTAVKSHLLAALAPPDTRMDLRGLPLAVNPSSLILIGPRHRFQALLDVLLRPIHKVQELRIHFANEMKSIRVPKNMSPALSSLISDTLRSGITSAGFDIADEARRRAHIDQPLLLLRNSKPAELMSLVAQVSDGRGLIIDENLAFSRSTPAHLEELIGVVTGAIHLPGATAGKKAINQNVRALRMGYIGLVDRDEITSSDLTKEDGWKALSSHSLILHVPQVDIDQRIETQSTSKEISSVIKRWDALVGLVIRSRLNGSEQRFNLDQEECARLLQMRREWLNRIDDLSFKDSHSMLGDTLASLYWMLSVSPGDLHLALDVHIAEEFVMMAKRLLQHYQDAETWLLHQSEREGLSLDKERLVRALERRGPCSWSDLRRSFDVQRRDAHEGAIQALIAEGTLELGDDGIFRLNKENVA